MTSYGQPPKCFSVTVTNRDDERHRGGGQPTAASLYHHFRNKDPAARRAGTGLDAATREIEPIACADQPSDVRLRAMIHAHVVALTENTAVGAAMVFEIRALMHVKAPPRSASAEDREAYQAFVDRRSAFFAGRDHFEDLFRRVIREGIAQGTFRSFDVPIFVKALMGANNWIGVWYRPDGRLSGAQIADLIADTMLRGVLA
ncbi:MAG: hypothetical protein LC121_22320 [Anaerolineae bacterium]|nr:hypothetical protein [Anaerolineae bacterium]